MDLLTQQILPRVQEPLGRPDNEEQTDADVQCPASPPGEVQASILLIRLAKGLHVMAGVNRLVSRPALNRLAPNVPNAKRLS